MEKTTMPMFYFLRNSLKYYLFFLWRLTDRLIQFVYWGMKGLKKYFTFRCWKMSRFAERCREEEKWLFSLSGSLTSRLLVEIGVSLAINKGTVIYSIAVRPQSHTSQLVPCLPLKRMRCNQTPQNPDIYAPIIYMKKKTLVDNIIEAVTASIMSPLDNYSSHSCRGACSGDMKVSKQACPD